MTSNVQAGPDIDPHTPRFRSGAVARLLNMPVSTLRIWERRYRVSAPPQSPSGHRLYAPADVERLLLLRELVDQGHAIGSVAHLEMPALLALSETRARLQPATAHAAPRLRTALLGLGLGRRLAGRPLLRVVHWADLASAQTQLEIAEAASADPQAADAPAVPQAALLIAEMPTLQPDSAQRLVRVMRSIGARRGIVLYAFGTEAAADVLRAAGCQLRRTPLPDAELAALIDDSSRLLAAPMPVEPPAPLAEVPPRLFDDETLSALATLSSTVACECPRHLSELVRLLGHFETYSSECSHSSPQDAALHAHLQQVSGSARAMLEAALLRVAEADGLSLPAGVAVAAAQRGGLSAAAVVVGR
ncbi:MAG: hypothetical protein RLY78_4332 [Pseudomonadota bacterium]|jgi:DNA-binding transcriptional MerR regulator